MVGNAARAVLVVVAMVLVSGCAAFASAPQSPSRPTAKPRPTIAQPPGATPTIDPASLAPPPFPDFRDGVMLVDRDFRLMVSHGLLERDRTGYRIHHRAEFHDGAVAHQLGNAPLMGFKQRVDDLSAKRLDRRKRTGFIPFDQARIGNDVGGHDRCEATLDTVIYVDSITVEPND